MNDRVRRAAIAAIAQISSDPAANDFLDPFQPSPEERDYFEKVTDPQDLGTIRARLANGEYAGVQRWLRGVDAVRCGRTRSSPRARGRTTARWRCGAGRASRRTAAVLTLS
jgi:hypothetical protein